ncbi:MAG: glycosyltransferase [Actinomycetota bacterium]
MGCTYRGMPETRAPVRNMIGANMSFRSEVFEEAGEFSSRVGRLGTLPLGCEETELCIRAQRRWPDRFFLYEPRSKVHHRVGPRRGTPRYFLSRCYAEGLSKAVVSRLAGSGIGLASERAYSLRVLPKGVLRELKTTILRADPAGIERAAAIIWGWTATAAGYVMGRMRPRRTSQPVPPVAAARELCVAPDSSPEVSVVIPVRDAEHQLEACLASVVASCPKEIIVVDGCSTDRTLEIARRFPVRVLSDEGRGLPVARLLGAEAAVSDWIALIDADVALPPGALGALRDEAVQGGYMALQAGLLSTSGQGYWGRALVAHHRGGRSKNWFGLVATMFQKEALLRHGFDDRFLSGEDIELRWRLERAGARIGVSKRTVVHHRFEDTWAFAKNQFLADGRGLARMITKHGLRAAWLAGMPAAAAARGMLLSAARLQPHWIPYYACFMVFNYIGMAGELAEKAGRRDRGADG